jgi:CheY-like chemotaxis protein
MDGYQVAVELRRAGIAATLVAMTGYGREEDLRRSREAGFARHLVKPVAAATLESLLDRYA